MSAIAAGFVIAGGAALVLARGLFVIALLGLFGTALFAAVVAPRALARTSLEVQAQAALALRRLACVELAAALMLAAIWLVAQSADMAGAANLSAGLAAVPTVVLRTEFGHVLLGQAGCLVATGLALRWMRRDGARAWLTLIPAMAATALQAGHGHAWAMNFGPSPLLAAGVIHLLAAGGWLGGLAPLLILVRTAPARVGAAAARWFSPLGQGCVAGIAVSSAWQFWRLIGGLPGLIGTAYGWVALLKLALLAVLLGFAARHRYRLAPALLSDAPTRARAMLVRSIAVQTGFGIAVVLAAAVLSSLPPAMHVQPWWPFDWQFSLTTVREDVDFRREVIGALVALAGALLAVVVLVVLRRRLGRLIWPGLAGAGVLAAAALPHLDLLLVAAYPTSFYHSPTAFSAVSIARGVVLYPEHCAACHGAEGRGDGPASAALAVPPADLTAAHLWMHSDGELFWWLTHGIRAPGGAPAMPGFAATLSVEDRWSLIDAIRAHNAGLAYRRAGAWPASLAAPALDADCADGGSVSLEQLKGGFVRVVFAAAAPPAVPGVTTILAGEGLPSIPPPGAGLARDPAVARAYATLAGIAPAAMAGMQFLVDGNGRLRAAQAPGASPSWNDPATLRADMHRFGTHAVTPDAAMDSGKMRM